MTRKCSHCSHNGHNSRTCPNRGVKLFGVRLTDGSAIRKSASMGNLSHYNGVGGGVGSSHLNNLHDSPGGGGGVGGGDTPDHGSVPDGYVSEDFGHGSSSSCRERKKGVPWTEEEHRMFLLGLQKLGKGDWRGISRNYVISRTPTQVASHAQKYFIRQSNMSRRKRRSSLFDIIADESVDNTQVGSGEMAPINYLQAESQGNNPLPDPPALDEEDESMDSSNSNDRDPVLPTPDVLEPVMEPLLEPSYPVMVPAYFSPFFPFSIPFWPGYNTAAAPPIPERKHEIVKPMAVHSKSPINVDELVGMSKLSLGDSHGQAVPSSLSLKSPEGSNRQSAFHANPVTETSSGKPPTSSSSATHAVY